MKLRVVMLIPLILVNGIAIVGQFIFWKSHLPFPDFAALGFALALESIAVYIAYYAHLAELSKDSAFRLRFASYAAGIIVGILNGSHWLNHGHLTAAATGMAMLSAASPFLWSIRTRRESRDALKSQGLIEDRAVKLGAMRWILWPLRAFPVFRLAIWHGESNPAHAIADWEESRAQAERDKTAALAAAMPQDSRDALESARTKADAIRIALAELGEALAASAVADWLRERGWDVTPAHVRAVKSQARITSGARLIALPSPAPGQSRADDQSG